jgi:hypothetical protein
LARLLKWVIQATPLGWMDRALGGVFGLFRALLVLAAWAMVMQFWAWAQQPYWQASKGAVALEGVLRGAAPFLPQAMQPWLPGPRKAAAPADAKPGLHWGADSGAERGTDRGADRGAKGGAENGPARPEPNRTMNQRN